MSFNTDQIVQEIRTEFESMLSYVLDSRDATADQMERGLFQRLLALGARLMVLFFSLLNQKVSTYGGRQNNIIPSEAPVQNQH